MKDITQEIPVIDGGRETDPAECRKMAEALAEVGCFALRGTDADAITPKVMEMMLRYYRQPDETKARHERAEVHHEVGWTPPFIETAKPHPEFLAALAPENLPTPFRGKDPKERFMTHVGPRPTTKEFAQFAPEPVLPEGFPEWEKMTSAWGEHALAAMRKVARMSAVGFGLDEDAFTRYVDGGLNLFAPTGSDLSKYGKPDTVLACWHDDLNFLSVHGKSNFPGLRVWTRDGRAVWVKVPDGCLLVQAGQQFEYLTGGDVLAGLHEVVSSAGMSAGIEDAERAGLVPWRVSTTLFTHLMADHVLSPIGRFATLEALAKYPPIKAGHQVQRELDLIGLSSHA